MILLTVFIYTSNPSASSGGFCVCFMAGSFCAFAFVFRFRRLSIPLNRAAIALNGRQMSQNRNLRIYGNIGNRMMMSRTIRTMASRICHHSHSEGICTGGVIALTISIGLDTTGMTVFTPSRLKVSWIMSKSKNTLSQARYACPLMCLSGRIVRSSMMSTAAE